MDSTPLETTLLGKTDLDITPVGFGAWAIGGGGWAFGWGPQDDDDSIAAIHGARPRGQLDRHRRRLRPRAIPRRWWPGPRGHVRTNARTCSPSAAASGTANGIGKRLKAGLDPPGVRGRACGGLKVDVIDLYQVHWPEPDEDVEEGWAAVAEAQGGGQGPLDRGLNFDAGQLRRAQAIAPGDSLQPPYSLVRREVETERCRTAGPRSIGVIAYSPMASGLLTGAWTRERIGRAAGDDWRRRRTSSSRSRC